MLPIDLTHPIDTGMQVYPGDPQVRLDTALDWENDGVRVTAVHLGSHTGTHLDAPSHAVPGGRTLPEIGLAELTGPALVLSAPAAQPGEVFDAARLASRVPPAVPRIVLLATGWDRHFGTGRYLEHPVPSPGLVQMLWQRGMRLLGVDTPSPDATLPPEQHPGFPVHRFMLGHDGLIVENLRGLTELPQHCRVGFFPLPLACADGAPVRAVAWHAAP